MQILSCSNLHCWLFCCICDRTGESGGGGRLSVQRLWAWKRLGLWALPRNQGCGQRNGVPTILFVIWFIKHFNHRRKGLTSLQFRLCAKPLYVSNIIEIIWNRESMPSLSFITGVTVWCPPILFLGTGSKLFRFQFEYSLRSWTQIFKLFMFQIIFSLRANKKYRKKLSRSYIKMIYIPVLWIWI